VNSGLVEVDEILCFPVTLFKDAKGTFLEKRYTFVIEALAIGDTSAMKPQSHGRKKLDLAQFAREVLPVTQAAVVEVPLKAFKSTAFIKLQIHNHKTVRYLCASFLQFVHIDFWKHTSDCRLQLRMVPPSTAKPIN
jgi:N-terminal C2 in EEIG1 and EHBP1 proteins